MSVATRTEGRVLVISMQREAKRNAIDAAMTAGLDAALNRLDDDASLWAGVLTGTATVFSAGTDLAVGPGPPTEPWRALRHHPAQASPATHRRRRRSGPGWWPGDRAGLRSRRCHTGACES